MSFKLSIEDLAKRPIIRHDKPLEFLNKMTDKEIEEFEKDLRKNIIDDDNIYASKLMDKHILYKTFKLNPNFLCNKNCK